VTPDEAKVVLARRPTVMLRIERELSNGPTFLYDAKAFSFITGDYYTADELEAMAVLMREAFAAPSLARRLP